MIIILDYNNAYIITAMDAEYKADSRFVPSQWMP